MSTAEPLKLRAWSPKMMGKEDCVGLSGRRGSGKTTGVLDIMYHHRDTAAWTLHSGSEDAYVSYADIVPETYIYEGWEHKDVVPMLVAAKKDARQRIRLGQPRVYKGIVCDDLSYDNSFCVDKWFKKLLMNGRHMGFAPLIVTFQDALALKPGQRGQLDWLIIFKEGNPMMRERIYKYFARTIGSLETFEKIFASITSNYGAMVIRMTGPSNRIEDTFFWWRAPIRDWRKKGGEHQKKWHVGSKEYWKFHYEQFLLNWEEKRERREAEDGAKKKKPTRRVKLLPAA